MAKAVLTKQEVIPEWEKANRTLPWRQIPEGKAHDALDMDVGYYPATGDTRASSMLSSAFTNIHKKAPMAVSSAAKSKA